MKRILFFAFTTLILGCSTDDGGENPPVNPPGSEEKPLAVNDELTATEGEELLMTSLLDNDQLLNNAIMTSISSESEQGAQIVDNRDGTITYIPAGDFVGVDTFTYEICDFESPRNCSTATVTVTVNDAGNPEAADDEYSTLATMTLTLDELLENDVVLDGAQITSVDAGSAQGTVELKEDGTVTYKAAAGFVGEDSFTYTLCDNDQPDAGCSTATVTVTVYEPIEMSIPADLQDYYGDLAFSEIQDFNYELLKDLTIEKHTTILSYGQRHDYLYDADEDLDNPENVIMMYSGESRYWREYDAGANNDYRPTTFNTEHIYPQSLLGSDDAVTDLHHLRVSDQGINTKRSNYPYTDGSGDYKLVDGNKWFPGDEWKGDVARMVMYLNVRYGEGFNSVGSLDLFLKWNIEDPVSEFEQQRNRVISEAQGVRNPFIDNPYLATLIWGGEPAENLWD